MFILGMVECLLVIILMLIKADVEWIPVVLLAGAFIAFKKGRKL